MHFLFENIFTVVISGIFLLSIFLIYFSRKDIFQEIPRRVFVYKTILFVLITSVLIFSIFGPVGVQSSVSRQWIDCIWILDASLSMDVPDVLLDGNKVTRLEYAKDVIGRYMQKYPENKYGLVIFAGNSRVISPLTSDVASVLSFLSWIHSQSISEWGTDFYQALEFSRDRLSSSQENSRVMVLLSDGWDSDEMVNAIRVRNIFQNKNIPLVSYGIGNNTPSPIPVGRDAFGEIIYKKFNNEIVLSWLNDSSLRILSKTIGGEYIESYQDLEFALSSIKKYFISSDDAYSDITIRILIGSVLCMLIMLICPFPFRSWNVH